MVFAVQMLVALYFVYIVARRPEWILPAALYSAIFEASAIVNIGSFALLPYYCLLMLLPLRCIFEAYDRDHFFGTTPAVRRIGFAVMCFAFVVITGCAVLPSVFRGVPVANPQSGSTVLIPLAPSQSHFAQATYLFLNATFIWWIAQRPWNPEAVRKIVAAYRGAGIVVLVLAFYQAICFYTGAPFPTDLLYTGHFAILNNDVIAGMPRISSTFTEAAGMAPFLLAYLAYSSEMVIAEQFRFGENTVVALASLVILILSTSSTAYLGLAALFGLALVRHGMLAGRLPATRLKIVCGVALMLSVVVLAIWFSPSLQAVVQQAVFEKKDSSSYQQRHDADVYSYNLAWQSYGFGVGLGSSWTSSFCAALLGSTGVPGAVAFIAMMYSIYRGCTLPFGWLRQQRAAFGCALLILILSFFMSCPNLSAPVLWVLIGTLAVLAAATEQWEASVLVNSDEQWISNGVTRIAQPIRFGGRVGTLSPGAT